MTYTKQKEVWKTYPELPFLEASNLGRVRTKDHWVIYKDGRKRLIKSRVLKQYLNKRGYMYVQFTMNCKHYNLNVHRIIATCFIPNPNNYPQVNHKDNDRTNNVVSNLEWCTNQYNVAYREKYGVSAKESTKVLRKPLFAINLETYEVFWFESRREAARKLYVDSSSIAKVIKGELNTAGGWWFTNADEKTVENVRAKFSDGVADEVEKLINKNL